MKYSAGITLYIVCLGHLACNAQQSQTSTDELRPAIQKIAKGIARGNVLESEFVGIAGTRSKQWDKYEKLKQEATNDELRQLVNNKNAVIRCYSFQALANRKGVDVFPILINHLNDTAYVETLQGCIGSSQTAGDYFLEVVTPQYVDLNAYKLTSNQRSVVDSILLFDKSIQIAAKYGLLFSLKPNQLYYNRIREIASKDDIPVAVLALARYNNKNDIGIIKKLFDKEKTEYYAAYSAREFPDSSFEPYLTSLFEKEWNKKLYDYPKWRILYQALAKYPTKETYKLFQQTIEAKDSFRYQTLGKYLMIALTKYPNEIFEPIKSRIALEEYYANEVKSEMYIEK